MPRSTTSTRSIPTAQPAELVKSWGDFTPDDVNLMEIARLRGDALRITEEVDFDG